MSRRFAVPTSAALALGAAAAAADGLEEALRDSAFLVDWRVRYETVDEAGFADAADAFTSRLRTGVQTGQVGKTSLLMEAVWIEDAVDDYNSTTNGHTQFPVVADPADFVAINRFAFTNQSLDGATLTFGRQRITLDDHRFVGNVGWRQNEQTYDALRAQLSRAALQVDLTYANQINRIFGPESAAGEWRGDIVLANLSHTFTSGSLTGFGYLLDVDDALAMSSNTLGLRLTGSRPVGAGTGTYIASYARQSDAGRNPSDYSENYYLLEGGLQAASLSLALGYEVLGGDGAQSFQTPLATLHAFQGWADKYLATPAGGIEDAYLQVGYAFGRRGPFSSLNVLGVYHDFRANAGSAHYGEEIDLSLAAATEHMTVTLKYASYSADQLWSDTDKIWLSLDYTFGRR
jgi:hypothetical protein